MHTTIPLRTGVLAGAAAIVATAVLILVLAASVASATSPNVGFGFNARAVNGAPTGEVRLTGGGSFNASTGFVHAGGGFRCTSSVSQGPLAGCLAGDGVRWDAAELLPSVPFKCTGATSEALKTASIDAETAVLRSDFYRAGDGNDESFRTNMIVSANDIAPDVGGVQNVWVQGVGCATATTNFSS
jgi:hypothetical protein